MLYVSYAVCVRALAQGARIQDQVKTAQGNSIKFSNDPDFFHDVELPIQTPRVPVPDSEGPAPTSTHLPDAGVSSL